MAPAYTLQGFRLINSEKLRDLKDEQVLELHKKGWLPLLHFHLQSLSNWANLSKLVGQDRGVILSRCPLAVKRVRAGVWQAPFLFWLGLRL